MQLCKGKLAEEKLKPFHEDFPPGTKHSAVEAIFSHCDIENQAFTKHCRQLYLYQEESGSENSSYDLWERYLWNDNFFRVTQWECQETLAGPGDSAGTAREKEMGRKLWK